MVGKGGRARMALVAAGFSAVALGFPLTAAASTQQAVFREVTAPAIPGAGAGYEAASCPSPTRCLVVGYTGTSSIVTETSDAGRTWTTVTVASGTSSQLDAISCPTATDCFAGGAAGGRPVVEVTHDGGVSWTAESVPRSALIDSISCPTTSDCVADGADNNNAQSLIATNDGGAAWSLRTSSRPVYPYSVSCTDATHCWIGGFGETFFTSDLGASLQPGVQLLPPGAFENSGATWDIDFVSQSTGYAMSEGQCGGTNVVTCPGGFFSSDDGGRRWMVISTWTFNQPAGYRIACSASTCFYAADADSHSVLERGPVSWKPFQQLPFTINGIACNPSASFCVVAGVGQNRAALYALGAAGPAPLPQPSPQLKPATVTPPVPLQSTLATSLATPASLITVPLTTLVNLLLVIALVVLVTFPAQLFNHTYEENHARLRSFWEAHAPWLKRLRRGSARLGAGRREAVAALVVLLVGALLGALLDPDFGANLRTLGLALGIALALSAGVAASGLSAGMYRRWRHRTARWKIRALPSGLLVAGVCVLVSRLVGFQPGYLYGVVGGVAFAGQLGARESGQEVAVASTTTLVLAVAAWLFWVPVSAGASSPNANFGMVLLQDFLAAFFVSALVGLVVGLVPLRFLPGQKLLGWHWGAWIAGFGLAAFALLEIMMRPQTAGAHVDGAPFWTTLALFLTFAAASVGFWGYFRVRPVD